MDVDETIVDVNGQRIIGMVGTTDFEKGYVNSLGFEVV